MHCFRTPWLYLALVVLTGCWARPSSTTPTVVTGTTALPDSAGSPSAPSASTTWGTSYETALDASRKRGVVVLADFTGSDWCPWCIRLREEVFETPEFKAWAATHVVLLEVDFPKHPLAPELAAQNNALQEKYAIESYPTVLLLDGGGNKVGALGYVKGGPAAWVKKAQEILDARPR